MSVSGSVVAADEIDLDFLPLIYQYLRCLEKEQAQTDLNKVALEATQKLTDLYSKISLAREQIPKLSGVEYSPTEQLQKLGSLRAQLNLKKQLLAKYKAKGTTEGSAGRD